MTLSLPGVTVVAIDNVCHDLLREAIKDTLREITPAEVIVWTDRYAFPKCTVREFTGKTLDDVGRVLWYEVPEVVKTEHFLVIQWDGWVLDARVWENSWQEYDYIGAPWWYTDGSPNVGNGGFSLRATEFCRFVAERKQMFPMRHPEDDTLCRRYRRSLDLLNAVFAPQEVAERFSFERIVRRPTFGFHGIFNWPLVLSPDRIQARMEMVNAYVRSRPEWGEFWTQARKLLVHA